MENALQNALLGALVADAVSMPVHWYYDTAALDRDYAPLDGYRAAKNPHPDSILWRSHYQPRTPEADILHDQAKYWGRRDIHYHQFLGAGENTVNFLLSIQLYRSTVRRGSYDPEAWLDLYLELMRKPGWHRDTYLEEFHRSFFDRLALGHSLHECAIDDNHIGGLTPVPFLLAALDALEDRPASDDPLVVRNHVALTHRNRDVMDAAEALTMMLHQIADGATPRDAIATHGYPWIDTSQLKALSDKPDRQVVGRTLSSACYLPQSFAAALFLTWKYANDFSAGVLANARCGGDNCHRGAVVGSLLAAANEIPEHWIRDLESMEYLRCDNLDAVFSA